MRHKARGQNSHESRQHHQIWRMRVNSLHQRLVKGLSILRSVTSGKFY